VQPALSVESDDELEGPSVQGQHEVRLGFHLGTGPRELARLRVPVSPCRAGELALSGPDEVAELKEVLQMAGQVAVDGGERLGGEIAPARGGLSYEDVGEIEAPGSSRSLAR
jgi:hypothetical protein